MALLGLNTTGPYMIAAAVARYFTFGDYQRMFEAAGFQKSELIEVPKSPSRLVISQIDL